MGAWAQFIESGSGSSRAAYPASLTRFLIRVESLNGRAGMTRRARCIHATGRKGCRPRGQSSYSYDPAQWCAGRDPQSCRVASAPMFRSGPAVGQTITVPIGLVHVSR